VIARRRSTFVASLLAALLAIPLVPAAPVAAETATHFEVTAASPQVVGASFVVTVTARDDANAIDTGYLGTIALTSSDPLAQLPSDYTFVAADNGQRQFDVTLGSAGTQSVTATDLANVAVTGTRSDITINPASQAITFGPLADRRFDESLGTLTATASSGLPVSFASQTLAVCTTGGANGASVTFVTVGTCTIQATQGGNANYLPATPVSRNFTITKGNQTITFNSAAPTNGRVGQSYVPTATASSELTVTFDASPVSVCQYKTASGAVDLKNSGTCTVTADQAGDTNWNSAPQATQSFAVTGPTATSTSVSSSANPSAYGQGVSFTATITPSTAVGTVQFVVDGANLGAPVAVAGGTAASGITSSLAAGNHIVVANFTSGDPVEYANSSGTLPGGQQVDKADQTITFDPLAARTYGDPPFTVSATASSGLAVTFISQTTGVCTTSGANGATVTIVAAGACTIRATQAGNANYSAATPVDQGFAVDPASQAITFGPLADRRFDESPPALAATASSGLLVSFASQTPAVCTTGGTNGASVTFVTVGTCTIQATQAGNGNYDAATPVVQSFTITKGNQTITFGALPPRTFDESPITVAATASSGLPVTFSSTTTGICTVSGTEVTFLTVGTCAIRASQAGTTEWNAAGDVNRSFVISKASQTITFGALGGKTYGDPPFTVSATASSGLPVSFATQTPSICTISGSTVTIAGGGTCTIRALQSGSSEYDPAPNVDQAFTVAMASQTITFDPLAARTYGDPPFTVSATASSGLAVTFISQTTGVCTTSGANGATVTIVAAGACTIRATQAGNANYSAATPVDQGFAVDPASQAITFGTLADRTYGDAPFAVSATASSGLPVSFASQSTAVCTVSGSTVTIVAAGTCTIRASQAGSAGYDPAADVERSFGVARKNLTVSGITSPGKTYDATTTAPLSLGSAALVGKVAADTVTLSTAGATGTFDTTNVGTGKTVTIAGLALGGDDAGNYTLTQPTTTASITKATLTVTADPQSRTYGAANPAPLPSSYSGFVGGETLATSGVSGVPSCTTTATTASGIGPYPISCTANTLAAANYAFNVVGGTLTVQPAPLTVTAEPKARQYGLPNPAPTSTVTGFVLGETAATAAGFGGAPSCSIATAQAAGVGTYPAAITCTAGTLTAANYVVGALVAASLTVTPAVAAPVVASSANPAAASQVVTITATVSWPAGTPTGSVSFYEGATLLAGPVDLVGGVASLTTSWPGAGDEDLHPITAVYSGDGGNFAQAAAAPFNQIVGRSAVDVVLGESATRWEANVPITFTADVHPLASGVTVPVDGTVAFSVDGALRTTVAVVGGKAAYTTKLALGTRTVTAAYTPAVAVASVFQAGTSAPLARTVVTNTITASGVGVSSSSVYPVKDTWKDTVALRGTRVEPLAVAISIYSPTGSRVRTKSYTRAAGAYSYAWNGRNSSGTILAAGKYKVVQVLTDGYGARKTYTSYVTLSRKRMYWYSKTLSVAAGPRRFSVAGDASIQSQYSTTSTRALTLSNPSDQLKWLAVGYQFTLPSASTYTSLSFQVQGSWTGTTAPKIALVPWSGGDWFKAMYSTSRARASMDTIATDFDAHTATNLTGIRSGRYVRAVIDSFAGPSGYSAGPYRYSITAVRLVVKYGILR
jgi:hypothetical protein